MCAIVGAILHDGLEFTRANHFLNTIFQLSMERGRDGRGWAICTTLPLGTPEKVSVTSTSVQIDRKLDWKHETFFPVPTQGGTLIGNLRAEPTTEFVKNKQEGDQQPYAVNGWHIVHNGTIANDKELRTGRLATEIDSAAIAELLGSIVFVEAEGPEKAFDAFTYVINRLKGSFAILAFHENFPGFVFAATNYRPIWFATTFEGTFFASSEEYFPLDMNPEMVRPYTATLFTGAGLALSWNTNLAKPSTGKKRALVVCSGGLDSVVAAKMAQDDGYDIELAHFTYGSRAEGPERKAVTAVAERLNVPLHFLPMQIYDPEDSPLLRADSTIAGGEAGAEFAHEWVPARNLVMLALATAYAEAKGFETIVLGNNLEEAGAYPDNEPEFIRRFNKVLPFAVGDGKRVQVIMPVGNMMKHEIVAKGLENGAPLDVTWSCYRAGKIHCGTCGPCFMRRTAFDINGVADIIPYETDKK